MVGGILLAMAVVWVRDKKGKAETETAKNTAVRILEEAKKDATAIKKEAELHAKDSVLKERAELEKEVRETRRELQNQERRLISKEEGIDKRVDSLDKRQNELAKRDQSLKARERNVEEKVVEYERHVDEARKQLEQVAGLTRDEAKRSLIDQMVEEAKLNLRSEFASSKRKPRKKLCAKAKRLSPWRSSVLPAISSLNAR